MATNTNKNTHNHPCQLEFHPQNHHHHLPLEEHLPPSHHPHHHHHKHQISEETMQPSSSSSSCAVAIENLFRRKDERGAYDLGELDRALFLYVNGDGPSSSSSVHQDQKQIQTVMRPPTLNIFPSQPMRVNPSTKVSGGGLVSAGTSCSKRPSETTTSMELANQKTNNNNNNNNNNSVASAPLPPAEPAKIIKCGGNRKGPNNTTSEHEAHKTSDPKTLRRLAQNREAARKSRLRKKAYIQQLESSRIKLTQLEQELHRARSQGLLIEGGLVIANEQDLPVNTNHNSVDAAIFDLEYARWLEEHHRLMCELRAAVQEHLPENELQFFVENGLAHYEEMMNLKGMIVKSDVFHVASGMWMTPAERCFMWLGGFRPSELIKVILNHLEPLAEQQILGICGLQKSTQETEESLSLGLEALNQSLSDTISSDSLSYPTNMANYMGQMAAAMDKLSTLEGFIRQADGLRHQTIHRLHQILTTQQFARCLLAIAEFFHRLRALTSLWLSSRPRQE